MTYDTRKIYHGTQEVTYGSSTDGLPVSYSTGVTSFAPSVDQDSKDVYADARTHMTLLNAKVLTIDIGNYQYTKEEMEQMGYKSVGDGFVDSGINPVFSIQRVLEVLDETGARTKRLEVYYDCKSGAYSESDDEDEDEINPKEYTRTLSVAGHDFGGNIGVVKQFIVEETKENTDKFEQYKTKLMLPTDFESTPSNAG